MAATQERGETRFGGGSGCSQLLDAAF